MARTKRYKQSNAQANAVWHTALYARLSREDGDKPESDSIANQKKMLENYLEYQPEFKIAGFYADDGYTGTNFDRPEFRHLIQDIESGTINCIVVKDLSRFGRDYIDVGHYLERWLPEHGVRFIAVSDNIDSERGPYDMILPVKNIINEQYARDISQKVRGSLQIKQQRGEFIGAFASYGYRKDPNNHNRLVIDPPAADIVRRIFNWFEQGNGKIRIAKLLNGEGIPCPSQYKKLNGETYHNGQKLTETSYWTYATVHRILNNQMYAGSMIQGKAPRQSMHGKAKLLDKERWAVVENTHEAIIEPEQWDRVQSLLQKDTRTLNFDQNISPFAGFLRCGDCGRAMSKTNHSSGVYYCCGSYKRYGPTVCTRHGISHRELEQVVLADLNKIIAEIEDLKGLADEARPITKLRDKKSDRERLQGNLERIYRLKKSAYEDYKDALITKEDYIRYKEDYQKQESLLTSQLEQLDKTEERSEEKPWIAELLRRGRLTELDRATVAETIKQIRVFEDGKIEITYTFSDDLGVLTDFVQLKDVN